MEAAPSFGATLLPQPLNARSTANPAAISTPLGTKKGPTLRMGPFRTICREGSYLFVVAVLCAAVTLR
jgi:hypothetical protein